MIKNTFEILIGGDFYINENQDNSKLFSQGLLELFEDADYRIINLETPIIESKKKIAISKTGPNLYTTPKKIIPFLKELNIDLATLANNHIMDYGNNGLLETLNHCKNNQIETVGVGKNKVQAAKPFVIKSKDNKIAILNFAENEWSSADENKSGANPMDIIENVSQIKQAKSQNDFVIVIIHGGHEYYHLPSPRMKKQYRFYAEEGADLIVCHHTHCIGGYEVFNNVPIFYSLGNFLFTNNSTREEWYTGLLLKLIIKRKSPISFDLIPIRQQKLNFNLRVLEGLEKEIVLKDIKKYNSIIKNDLLLLQNWNSFLKKSKKEYFQNLSPLNIIGNRYIRGGLRLIGINKLLMRSNYLKLLLNLMRCEAHVDASKAIIENHLKKRNK